MSSGQKRKLSPDYVVSDSEGETGNVDNVKNKREKEPQEEETTDKKKNEQGETFFEIGPKRRITVRKFKGKPLIDIREFWEPSPGELAPGKKGISLSVDQWNRVKDLIDQVDLSIKEL